MGASSSVCMRYSSHSPELVTGIDEKKLCVPFHKTDPTVTSSKTCGYEIAYKIGEGAFSDVRVAYRKDNREKVCIKEINMSYCKKEYANQTLFEFNILSQLNHPDIVKIYEVFYSKNKNIYYMVTELLHGGELFDSICERDHYTEGDARKIMQTVTETLLYCHSQKVIHRDIKPENLILQDRSLNATIKLVDFGFARVLSDELKPFSDLRGQARCLLCHCLLSFYSLTESHSFFALQGRWLHRA
jgi:serine/threonine protein kinase